MYVTGGHQHKQNHKKDNPLNRKELTGITPLQISGDTRWNFYYLNISLQNCCCRLLSIKLIFTAVWGFICKFIFFNPDINFYTREDNTVMSLLVQTVQIGHAKNMPECSLGP